MKKGRIILVLALTLILVTLSGCFYKDDNIITDCKTGKVVASFSTKEHEKEAILLTNATNYLEDKETKVKSKPKYLVHFVDPKDSINDVYYYIYIENNNIYVQFDTVKMKELIDKFDVGLDDSIKKTTVMTVKDLDSVLALK